MMVLAVGGIGQLVLLTLAFNLRLLQFHLHLLKFAREFERDIELRTYR